MKPLVFLTVRTLFNGVKRALTNPRRLVAFAFASFWLLRFVFFPSGGEQRAFDVSKLGRASTVLEHLDIVRILDAVVFTVFVFLTFFLALGSLSTRNTFKPADVDVLFPTPVEPRLVLIFRILRDYLLTLLAPIFFIIVGYRPASLGVKSLQNVAENPQIIQQTMRVALGTWLLVAFCWVCINYSASLFVNRSDLASSRNRRILGWTMGLTLIGVGAYIAYQVRFFSTWQDWAGLTESPLLRTVFFTATLAVLTVHGVVTGEVPSLLLGFGGLIAIISICLYIAVKQAGWMYDQAAVKGFDQANARQLQQSGDTIGLITAQARQGKVKAGRLTRWVSRKTVAGPKALLWKEVILTLRSTWFLVVLFGIISLFMVFLPLVAGIGEKDRGIGYAFLFLQALGVFMNASALSQAGFIEMLRRVDVQKPLPFNFSTTILYEVLAKATPGALGSWLCSILAVIIRPDLWDFALAGMIAMPLLAVVICVVTCLTTILFPDFEDPTQRGFRGLMNFVGVIVAGAPGVLAFIGLTLGVSPLLAAVVSVGINIGMAALIASIAGNQYAQFNPSE